MAKVAVILPAAGASKRFGDECKIVVEIAGEPIFLHTVRRFLGRDDVCQVLLVVPPVAGDELQRRLAEELYGLDVKLVTGGATRTESVRNALAQVVPEADLVAVHDAVRPCVTAACIDAVFAEAARSGAALLAWPVHATLKRVGPGEVVRETLSREDVWEAQTPQVFRKDWLVDVYAGDDEATDDTALVQAAGHEVRVVPGDPRNIKITRPDDLALAEAILETMEQA